MEFSERKHPRLKGYDYSLPGYYYVTIQTARKDIRLSTVGRGLAPADAVVILTPLGQIVRQQLLALQTRDEFVEIDKYIIMPTHIHAIIRLTEGKAQASTRPTLMDVVCAYKSLTTRAVNQVNNTPGQKLFQTSFYETVLRNERAYQECWRYIDENPQKWLLLLEE